jgi:hypothetical protein
VTDFSTRWAKLGQVGPVPGQIFCARNSNSVTFALRQNVCGRECVSEFDGQIRWWKRTFSYVIIMVTFDRITVSLFYNRMLLLDLFKQSEQNSLSYVFVIET